jgi:hypothetical protein
VIPQKTGGSHDYSKESAAVFTQKRGSLEYSKERAVLIATKEEGSRYNLKQ